MDAASDPIEWTITGDSVPYADAVRYMEARVEAIHRRSAPEQVWLLQHPPLYTAGTSAKDGDLISTRFPVFQSGRGGQYTYHGPGQRVAYVMLDLNRRKPDVRGFVHALEEWMIRALARFNVKGERRRDRIGIWVARGDGREDKIAAIGVRLRHWVTFHGVSLNVDPELEHFSGIVPCGVRDAKFGVTSLAALGLPVTMADVDVALKLAFEEIFGPVADARMTEG
ncbi:MAG TPA: lipoyl(octanoyl) transferase LipB [Micropepsaceae bacterium]|nr:lipoyl(octanoyl) transferase LipB [Micropepsaceae bacterium]